MSSAQANLTTDDIESARLRLVSLGPAFLDALLEGRREEAEGIGAFAIPSEWPQVHLFVMRLRQAQMREDASSQPWLLRAMVLRETNEAIGYINFHGPPYDGRVEVGYTVEPEHRRKGYAEEAVRAMFPWAKEHGATRFVASISPDNQPSLDLIAKLKFEPTGVQWDDEDGEELLFELDAANFA